MAEFFENKDLSLMCPNCNKFLLQVDKRDTRKNIIKCKHCGKLITYVPATQEREISYVPLRDNAHGKRFY
jgi:phage FluMu protein Com